MLWQQSSCQQRSVHDNSHPAFVWCNRNCSNAARGPNGLEPRRSYSSALHSPHTHTCAPTQHSTHSQGREAARTAALGQRRCIYISLVIYSVALNCACSLSLTIYTLHRTQKQPSQHVCNWCIVHTHTHSPSQGTLPTAPISHSFDTHVIHMTHREM
jgi:hypothetical protein